MRERDELLPLLHRRCAGIPDTRPDPRRGERLADRARPRSDERQVDAMDTHGPRRPRLPRHLQRLATTAGSTCATATPPRRTSSTLRAHDRRLLGEARLRALPRPGRRAVGPGPPRQGAGAAAGPRLRSAAAAAAGSWPCGRAPAVRRVDFLVDGRRVAPRPPRAVPPARPLTLPGRHRLGANVTARGGPYVLRRRAIGCLRRATWHAAAELGLQEALRSVRIQVQDAGEGLEGGNSAGDSEVAGRGAIPLPKADFESDDLPGRPHTTPSRDQPADRSPRRMARGDARPPARRLRRRGHAVARSAATPTAMRPPARTIEQRLRHLYTATWFIASTDGPGSAHDWLMQPNPELENRAPAELLRDGALARARSGSAPRRVY